MKLFIINIGGSSSKLALYDDENMITGETIRHTGEETRGADIWEQYDMRKRAVRKFMDREGINPASLSALVSRGPSVKPLKSGTYYINQAMIDDAKSRRYGSHPCGLGCAIALELAVDHLPALTVDPPCVDEMIPLAKYTGLPDIKRRSFFQALNHKAVAKRFAKERGKNYEDLNIIVSHLGSGISVATHYHGEVIDVTNGLDGDAPFGLDRVGTMPAADWMEFCLSGKYTREELHGILNGNGGMMAYLGTNSAIKTEEMIREGNKKAEEVYAAMAFQVAKGIGAAAAAGGKPDAIILTGGLANSEYFTDMVKKRICWIADVYIFAGENEMFALAEGALRGLRKEETIFEYTQDEK
jgi:butyrate kinase